MKKLNLKDITQYVEDNIGIFHQKRTDSLNKLKLKTILKKKNPYLFKAKYLMTADQIIKGLTDAFISSNEETIFGDWLEGLAIHINSIVYGGWKSGITGIDLEFDNENIRYIVTIKSGPNWGNSNSNLQIMAVNGCCYGKDNVPDKGDYFKYCGQRFWEFISGNENLYIDLIEPLGHKAKERNDEFMKSYSKMINKFTKEFILEFCKGSGEIDWDKLVRFNSEK